MARTKKLKEEEVLQEKEKIDIDFDAFFEDIAQVSYPAPTYIDPLEVKYEGMEVIVNDLVYVLPSLSGGDYQRLLPKIRDFEKWDEVTQAKFMYYLCHYALKRNYPDITKEWVDDVFSVYIVARCIEYIISGLTPKDIENQKKSLLKNSKKGKK